MIQELFVDDQVANTLESLAGTLKAAKKKAVVSYGPELLLQVWSKKRSKMKVSRLLKKISRNKWV